MIRRFTSAQFVPADAGSKDKNPMGSALVSTPIIAPTNLDRHQILRNFCHESVRKGLNRPEPFAVVKPIAVRLMNAARCDFGTQDLSHVWRIPGTPNWPNAKKVAAGRPRRPH